MNSFFEHSITSVNINPSNLYKSHVNDIQNVNNKNLCFQNSSQSEENKNQNNMSVNVNKCGIKYLTTSTDTLNNK